MKAVTIYDINMFAIAFIIIVTDVHIVHCAKTAVPAFLGQREAMPWKTTRGTTAIF